MNRVALASLAALVKQQVQLEIQLEGSPASPM